MQLNLHIVGLEERLFVSLVVMLVILIYNDHDSTTLQPTAPTEYVDLINIKYAGDLNIVSMMNLFNLASRTGRLYLCLLHQQP